MFRSWLIVLTISAACASAPGRTSLQQLENGVTWEYERRDGLPDGASLTFYPSGSVKSRGRYKKGRKHGAFVHYRMDGTVERKEVFASDSLVWSSEDPKAEPPPSLLAQLDRIEVNEAPRPNRNLLAEMLYDHGPLEPHFVMLAKSAAPSSLGIRGGAGGSTADGHRAQRASVYANYRMGRVGMFAQLEASRLQRMHDAVRGRSTAELAASYQLSVGGGQLSPTLAVAVPLGHDDSEGSLAAVATSYHRPADAALTLPATVAARSGASWVRAGQFWVTQADLGVDWAMGGGRDLRPFARANGALGMGRRSFFGTIELSNVMRMDATDQRVHALGGGVVLSLADVWLSTVLSRTTGSHTVVMVEASYDL